MSTELTYLLMAAVLAGSLWIPFIIGSTTEAEDFTDFARPPDLTRMRPWVHRAFRAHQNLLETIIPFGIAVVVAHLAGVSTQVTVWAATAFFWVRVVHAAGMISGLAGFPLRPVIFTASYLCTLAIAGAVFLA